MTANGWLQIFVFAVAVLAITKPAGLYILRVYDGSMRWLAPVERAIYRVSGIDPDEDQHCEVEMRRFLRAALQSHEYQLVEATTARDGLAQAAGRNPDVILLDLGLPDGDGIDLTRRIREWSKVPIIVLSARGREEDKVAALDAGADDYLTKPFGVGELLARLRVALRHSTQADGEPIFTVGGLRVDFEHRRVFVDDSEVHLTPTEYKLLTTLIRHAGKVLTHRQLLKEVWGPNAIEHTHYLRVYMTQLRHKLEADAARPRYLLTEPGVGYRLQAE